MKIPWSRDQPELKGRRVIHAVTATFSPRACRPFRADGCGGHRFLRRCRRLSPVAALRQENNATRKCERRTHPSGSPRPPSAPKGQQAIGRGKRSDALDATPTPKRSSSPGSWFRCARHLPSSQGPLRTGQAAFPHPAPHTPPFRSICRAPYPFQLRGHAIVPLGVGRMRLLARVMVCVVPFARRALPRFFANLAAFPGTIPRPGALAAAPFTLHAVTRPEVRPRALLSPRTFNPLSGPGLAWLAL
jgi:hypothetical protein